MNINATFLGQMIAMAFFVWFCTKYVWPPFVSIMEERKKRIADGLEAASKAERDLESAKAESEEHLKAAKVCLLYTSPSPRDATLSRMPSSA